ncbi:TIGR01244 family sulfur transferase [Hyphomicrobium sp. 99]|uniref:TIGR01244 family sulfur transferase n=1 Tax=Hyphomicrobium sp. 99 TaxID=1163419 RepID=UPI0005F7EB94|nr:TIGR01244 family sulfur transferase [Hyphomicrobium sp. 99]
MSPIRPISDSVSISSWLDKDDFSDVKALGFQRVINFRPDNEARDQIPSTEAEAAAREAGLHYTHIPVTRQNLFTDEVVRKAVSEFAPGERTLAYCASGQRAAIVWAAVTARSRPVDEVLSSAQGCGFDLRLVRDDLEAQAVRAQQSET